MFTADLRLNTPHNTTTTLCYHGLAPKGMFVYSPAHSGILLTQSFCVSKHIMCLLTVSEMYKCRQACANPTRMKALMTRCLSLSRYSHNLPQAYVQVRCFCSACLDQTSGASTYGLSEENSRAKQVTSLTTCSTLPSR